MRILIVDDSPVVWRRLLDMLRDLSFVSLLAYARNLTEAYNCLNGFIPDLLVLDVSLPDGSGLDLLAYLRASKTEVKVAVFSNVTELRDLALARGADWYFDKSLDFQQFIKLLNDRAYWCQLAAEQEGYSNA